MLSVCACSNVGSLSTFCRSRDGQCQCRRNFQGQKCNECRIGFYDFPSCKACNCNPAGIKLLPGQTNGCGSVNNVRYTWHQLETGKFSLLASTLENGGLFSSVRPTVHTNPSRQQSFSKTVFKPEEFENAGFAFSCGRKMFYNGDCSVFKFLRGSVDWALNKFILSKLRFSSFPYCRISLTISLTDVIYQPRNTSFGHISKHWVESCILNTFVGVCFEAWSNTYFVFDTLFLLPCLCCWISDSVPRYEKWGFKLLDKQ